MVKFKHLAKFDVDFSGFNYVSVNDAGTKAIYTKEGSDLKFVVKGSELVGDGSYLTDGVINQMIVLNSKGIKAFTTSSNLQLDAETVDGYIDTHSLGALIRDTAGNGNDRVIGSNKGEFLLAGGGNDTMTGGRGSDYFQFHSVYDAGIEHDVITDFQVRGKNRDELQYVEAYTLRKANSNTDTVMTFDDGSTLTLEGVTRKEFKQWVLDTDYGMLV